MLTIYLDQNKWIDLRRAAAGIKSGLAFVNVLGLARSARAKELASFPLSSVHYLETWKDQNQARRIEQARVMAELSDFNSLLKADRLYEIEIERAASKHFGRPDYPPPLEVFGKGFDHAFGSLTPRFVPEFTGVPPPAAELLAEQFWKLWEFCILGLVPLSEDIEIPGPEAFVGIADQFRVAEAGIASRLKEYTKASKEREAVALMRTLLDVWQLGQGVFERSGVTIDHWLELGAVGLQRFLEDIPTRYVTYLLEAIRYQDPDLPREGGDLFDLAALSTALAYCDVVVTERTWQHIVGRTGIKEKYGTMVLSRLEDLVPVLIDLGA